jgi:hypothetical protein
MSRRQRKPNGGEEMEKPNSPESLDKETKPKSANRKKKDKGTSKANADLVQQKKDAIISDQDCSQGEEHDDQSPELSFFTVLLIYLTYGSTFKQNPNVTYFSLVSLFCCFPSVQLILENSASPPPPDVNIFRNAVRAFTQKKKKKKRILIMFIRYICSSYASVVATNPNFTAIHMFFRSAYPSTRCSLSMWKKKNIFFFHFLTSFPPYIHFPSCAPHRRLFQ